MSWAAPEFETVELSAKRLNNRLVKLARQLALQLVPNHAAARAFRATAQGRLPVTSCLHVTTGLDFNGQTIQGLGALSYEAQRSMHLG